MDAFQGIVIGPGLSNDRKIQNYLPDIIRMANKN